MFFYFICIVIRYLEVVIIYGIDCDLRLNDFDRRFVDARIINECKMKGTDLRIYFKDVTQCEVYLLTASCDPWNIIALFARPAYNKLRELWIAEEPHNLEIIGISEEI